MHWNGTVPAMVVGNLPIRPKAFRVQVQKFFCQRAQAVNGIFRLWLVGLCCLRIFIRIHYTWWCSTGFTSFQICDLETTWDLQVALHLQGFRSSQFFVFSVDSFHDNDLVLATACRLVGVSLAGDILVLNQNAAMTMTHDGNVMKSGRIDRCGCLRWSRRMNVRVYPCYCWWFRNPGITSWGCSFVPFLSIFYRVCYMPGGAGFLPSTVKFRNVAFQFVVTKYRTQVCLWEMSETGSSRPSFFRDQVFWIKYVIILLLIFNCYIRF